MPVYATDPSTVHHQAISIDDNPVPTHDKCNLSSHVHVPDVVTLVASGVNIKKKGGYRPKPPTPYSNRLDSTQLFRPQA
jgi:hypothetical protein